MFSPMLAHEYADDINPTGWWISEKLDGVRALWDGRQLLSRNKKPFSPPTWFTDRLPSYPLDGELWIGHGKFDETKSIVQRKKPIDTDWQKITYFLFDSPSDESFEERYQFLYMITNNNRIPSVAVLPQTVCVDRSHLEACYHEALESGGEGVMLRAARSCYEAGRSEYLLKYKPTFTTEGVLIGTETGTGRCAGIVGTLILRWNGLTVRVGSGLTDDVRRNPPELGTQIEFEHKGLNPSGQPRHAVFRCVRNYE
jgi:DNA ligase-1